MTGPRRPTPVTLHDQDRPEQACRACGHPYGSHYETFDRQAAGCTFPVPFGDHTEPCICKGFNREDQ